METVIVQEFSAAVASSDSTAPLDDATLRSLLELLHAESYGWALNCCRRRRDQAENVLQLVYLKVLSRKAVFDGRSSFKTWLFSVIRKTAAGERRTDLFRKLRLGTMLRGTPHFEPNGEDLALRNEVRRQLKETLLRLPPRQSEVLFLVFYHDLTIVEAAKVMGVGVGSARTHYERGKKQMRRCLEIKGVE